MEAEGTSEVESEVKRFERLVIIGCAIGTAHAHPAETDDRELFAGGGSGSVFKGCDCVRRRKMGAGEERRPVIIFRG